MWTTREELVRRAELAGEWHALGGEEREWRVSYEYYNFEDRKRSSLKAFALVVLSGHCYLHSLLEYSIIHLSYSVNVRLEFTYYAFTNP